MAVIAQFFLYNISMRLVETASETLGCPELDYFYIWNHLEAVYTSVSMGQLPVKSLQQLIDDAQGIVIGPVSMANACDILYRYRKFSMSGIESWFHGKELYDGLPPVAYDYSRCESQLSAISDIWKAARENRADDGAPWKMAASSSSMADAWTPAKAIAIRRMGKELGVDHMISAFLSGVPLEDIIAMATMGTSAM